MEDNMSIQREGFNSLAGLSINVSSLSEVRTEPGTIERGLWHIGSDPSGLSEPIPIIVMNGKEDGPTLWIQGCIHGDEFAAAWAVTSLAREIDPKELKGRLILLPILNISAFRARRGSSPIDNVELYRAFPGSPSGSYTAQIAHAISKELVAIADYMIDVHSGNSIYRCVQFASYPGGMAASAKAEEIALATGSPIVVRRNEWAENEKAIMFMYACSQGIPSVMISVGGHRRIEPQFIQPLIESCKGVMRFIGMIPGEAVALDRSKLLKGIYYIFSTKGGFVLREAENGSWLEKGQIIVRLYNVYGEEVEVIRCPFDKALLIETPDGALYPGELVAELFLPLK